MPIICSLRRPAQPASDSSTENRRKRHKRTERANNRLARTFSRWARISSGAGAEGAGARACDTAIADCEVCLATMRLLIPRDATRNFYYLSDEQAWEMFRPPI